MAPRDLRISTALEIAVGTQFYAQLITEPDWEASWLLLPSSVSLISGAIVQPENIYYSILKVTGQVWESQKRISINTKHSYHSIPLPKPAVTDLAKKSDSVLTTQ